jgi:hypothetical protein
MRNFFREYPDLNMYLDTIARTQGKVADDLKNLISLVSELSYKDGLIDGMKALMEELLNNKRLGWVALLLTALLAERASSWPYGVIMSLKAIF